MVMIGQQLDGDEIRWNGMGFLRVDPQVAIDRHVVFDADDDFRLVSKQVQVRGVSFIIAFFLVQPNVPIYVCISVAVCSLNK